MQIDQARESANRIEQCADDAVRALQGDDGAPAELRDSVSQMHQEARRVRDLARQSSDEQQLAGAVDRLEQLGDRAKQACMSAGDDVDAELRSAVVKAHDE